MGKMSDMLIDNSTNEEMKGMIDNARAQHTEGYIQFLEGELKKAELKINKLKEILTGECVECFKSLDPGEIICGKCQDEMDGRWDHLRE